MRKNHPALLLAASQSPAESEGDVSHAAALVLSVSRAEPHGHGVIPSSPGLAGPTRGSVAAGSRHWALHRLSLTCPSCPGKGTGPGCRMNSSSCGWEPAAHISPRSPLSHSGDTKRVSHTLEARAAGPPSRPRCLSP